MSGFIRSRGRFASLLGLTLCVSLLAAFVYVHARSRFFANISLDEEQFIWFGSLINNGDVPYRDFFEPKPPVIFFANAIGLALFGFKDLLFRIVPTAVSLSSLLFFYLALVKRKVVPWLSALLTAQAALWLVGSDFHDGSLNDTENYGFAFALLGFSMGSLSAAPRAQYGRIGLQVLCGIFFAFAVLSKELFVLSVIPALLIAARHPEHNGWRWQQLVVSTGAGIAVGLFFLVYLVYHSALGPYWDLIKFYRAFAANYCLDIGQFPRVTGLAVLMPSLRMLHEKLYNIDHLAFMVPLWYALPFLIVYRKADLAIRWTDLAIAVMALILGMVAISVGHCFWKHYFLMGTTGLLLFTVFAAEALSQFLSNRTWRTSAVFVVGISGVFFWISAASTRQAAAERSTFRGPTWDREVVETIEKHSKPGDYILSTQESVIYVALNRKAPLGTQVFLDEVLPYIAATNPELSMDRLRDDLEKHLPKVMYFGSWLRNRQAKHHKLLFDPVCEKYHYIKVNDRLWYLPDS